MQRMFYTFFCKDALKGGEIRRFFPEKTLNFSETVLLYEIPTRSGRISTNRRTGTEHLNQKADLPHGPQESGG